MVCGDLSVQEIKSAAEQKKRHATSQMGRDAAPGSMQIATQAAFRCELP
jgi:hypothetical protein